MRHLLHVHLKCACIFTTCMSNIPNVYIRVQHLKSNAYLMRVCTTCVYIYNVSTSTSACSIKSTYLCSFTSTWLYY